VRIAFPGVIPRDKQFLKPAIQQDEHVATAHFLDFEFADAMASVGPGVWQHDGFEAANVTLQREFHSQIEVWGKQGLTAIYRFSGIELEGIGCVVVSRPKEDHDQSVEDAVEQFLRERIIMDLVAAAPAGAENRVSF
jgi:hypothetical protein